MTMLRLIADDLTGALDTAIPFVAAGDSIPVMWAPNGSAHVPGGGGHLAVDSATREAGRNDARARVAALAGALGRGAGADTLFYAKLDSLLRGNGGAEIAGWIDALRPDRCIVAPAFPRHGRVTRDGVQYLRDADGCRPVGARLVDDLAREGLSVVLCRPEDPAPDGVSLWDCESDADLACVVTRGRARSGITLWCGSGGLAAALAGGGHSVVVAPADLPRPILGLFGTDHPVTHGQIAACGEAVITLADGGAESVARVAARLAEGGPVLVKLALSEGTARSEASARIAGAFSELIRALSAPGTLIVAGGETLRDLCHALGAERLDLNGEIEPGVPRSILRGGRFDGVHVVSKSGAFGAPDLLKRLTFPFQGDHA